MSPSSLLPRSPLPVGFKTGLAVGVVLISAIRGCAFDVAHIVRSLDDDAPPAQAATTRATSAVDELPAPTVIPTANVDALPHVAVRVEDLPRSRMP